MNHWNNRIFIHKSPEGDWYAIHETHYDSAGKPVGWTVDPTEPFGETVDELISSLKMMLTDAERFKDAVIDYDSEPEGDDDLPRKPNAETIAAMEAARRGEGKSTDTVSELMEELNKDDE